MIDHRNKRKKQRGVGFICLCLALLMLCGVALPAYATALDSDAGQLQVLDTNESVSEMNPAEEEKEQKQDEISETQKETTEVQQENKGQQEKEAQAEKDAQAEKEQHSEAEGEVEKAQQLAAEEEGEKAQQPEGEEEEEKTQQSETEGQAGEAQQPETEGQAGEAQQPETEGQAGETQQPDTEEQNKNGSPEETETVNQDISETLSEGEDVQNENTEENQTGDGQALPIAELAGLVAGIYSAPASQPGETDTYDAAVEDENYIIVQKNFVGITRDQIPDGFSVTVTGNGNSRTLYKQDASISENGDTVELRWKISGVGEGTYTVKEDNYEVPFYEVKTEGTEGSVTVSAGDFAVTKSIYEPKNSVTYPVNMTGDVNHIFAAPFTGGYGTIVISQRPLSASQRAKISQTLVGGEWKSPVHFFSIEANGNIFTVQGINVTYDPEKGTISFNAKGDWKKVATLEYSISQANNPEICITNTYAPEKTKVTIRKLVAGGWGDREKSFAFSYTALDKEGNIVDTSDFSLKHGESKTIEVVPGTNLTITEQCGDYDVEAVYGETPAEVSGVGEGDQKKASFSVTVEREKEMITVTNTNEPTVDVGVSLDDLPYKILLLTAAAGLFCFAAVRMRKIEKRKRQ